jgi:surface protein
MFGTCTLLTKIEGLESFNTSKVTNMCQLFMGCTALTELDLSRFDVSKVTNIDYIFQFDNALTKLNLSNWHIQPDVRVEAPFMGTMTFTIFTNCYELTNIIMNDSDCDSINKIISVLPTRTSDSPGVLNISVDNISQVDTATAESKYWNIINEENAYFVLGKSKLGQDKLK